jgi:hypothetical protein
MAQGVPTAIRTSVWSARVGGVWSMALATTAPSTPTVLSATRRDLLSAKIVTSWKPTMGSETAQCVLSTSTTAWSALPVQSAPNAPLSTCSPSRTASAVARQGLIPSTRRPMTRVCAHLATSWWRRAVETAPASSLIVASVRNLPPWSHRNPFTTFSQRKQENMPFAPNAPIRPSCRYRTKEESLNMAARGAKISSQGAKTVRPMGNTVRVAGRSISAEDQGSRCHARGAATPWPTASPAKTSPNALPATTATI